MRFYGKKSIHIGNLCQCTSSQPSNYLLYFAEHRTCLLFHSVFICKQFLLPLTHLPLISGVEGLKITEVIEKHRKIENNSQIRRIQGENELITETMSRRGMSFISSSITTMAFLWLASNKCTPKEKLYSKNLTFIRWEKNGQRKWETKEIQQRSELPRAMPHVGGFPSSQF